MGGNNLMNCNLKGTREISEYIYDMIGYQGWIWILFFRIWYIDCLKMENWNLLNLPVGEYVKGEKIVMKTRILNQTSWLEWEMTC